MSFKCQLGLHDWTIVYCLKSDMFLGEFINKKIPKFRVCKKCGFAQKIIMRIGCDEWYFDLSEEEKEILMRKIKRDEKGDYIVTQC